ncbi:MAG: ABC transporter permease [Gemmatimonadetes bacterium]|nr:ABC transporter permease [Gemmatimonadota bacterium]
MQLGEGIRVAFQSLWAYKLRTFLTVLGNIVAVGSVITVVSLIDGMDLFVRQEIADEGSNVLTLTRLDPFEALTNFELFLESLHNPDITLEDYRSLRDERPSTVAEIAAYSARGGRVERGGRAMSDIPIQGWTADYPAFRDAELTSGRHFNHFEERNSRPVAVVGSEIVEQLLRGQDPLGETVRVNGRHLEIIGVLKEEKGLLGNNPNRVVVTPLGNYLKIFGGGESLDIRLNVAEIAALDEARDEIRLHMRIRHRLKPAEDDDFAVTSSERIVTLWKSISQAIFSALVALVSISLVIGGVVIMNIMLVSVTERTKEVGTRKALGARRVDILWQFLVESVTLSMTGGLIGILLGFGLASLVSIVSPLPYAIEPWSIIAGLFVTFAVGIFFGIYPANRAAKLDPVEALRRE